MEKIFQPKVKLVAQEMIDILTETNFFTDHDIESPDYAFDYLCEKLTDKFIENGLDVENGIFTEEEIELFSREIIAGSILEQLKRKGYLQSYSDENTEEVYFLSDLGKKVMEEINDGKRIKL